MTTPITKELREHAEENVKALRFALKQNAFKDIRDAIEMDLKVAEFALAAMDAEPIYQVWDDGKWCDYEERLWRELYDEHSANMFRIVYMAPPASRTADAELQERRKADAAWKKFQGMLNPDDPAAPVMPDSVEIEIENLKQKLVDCNRYNYCADAVKRVEDSCRAAIRQGNSPVVPDGLRMALSNAGMAAPESDELLYASVDKYIQMLVTWVKDRKPFQPAPVLPEDIPDSVYEILCQACGGKAWMYEDALWKACLAAMLNGDKS